MARSALHIALVLLALGCVARTPDAHPPLAALGDPDTPYRIKVGDVLDVRFYKTPELNLEVPVRSDGRISVELIGDVQAAGLEPEQLADALTRLYARELTDPIVSVIVRTFGGAVYVSGEVGTPQAVPFGSGLTALQAIHQAGGFVVSARRTTVVLMRRQPEGWRGYTLDLKDVIEGEEFQQDVALRANDIIHVHRSRIGNVNLFVEQFIQNNMPVQPVLPTF